METINGKFYQKKIWNLQKAEISQESNFPVVALDVGVGHGQVIIAPR